MNRSNDKERKTTGRRQPSLATPLRHINALAGVLRDTLPHLKHPSSSPTLTAPVRTTSSPLAKTRSRRDVQLTPAKLPSAIHRTPPELWTQILLHTVPTPSLPRCQGRPAHHPSLPLSQISSSLRVLAHSTPELWLSLALAREDHDRAPEAFLELVTAWLTRTHGQPLALALTWVPFDSAPPRELLDLISSHSRSIASLYLSVAAPALRTILALPLPRLTSLTLAIRAPLPPSEEPLCPHAPRLRELELEGPYQDPTTLGLPLGQLTKLSAQYPLRAAPALALLAEAHRLERAALRVVAPAFMLVASPVIEDDDEDDNALPPSPTTGLNAPPPLTRLPSLTSLTLTTEHAGPLLSALHAPSLSELSLVSTDRRTDVAWPAAQVVSLSAPLTKLTVRGRKVRAGEIRRVLAANPALGDVEVEWGVGQEVVGERILEERRAMMRGV